MSAEDIIMRNRQHKADGIAAFLFEHDIGPCIAALQTGPEWLIVARLAGYKEAPSEITRAMILDRLQQFEQNMPRSIQ
jgi:hypothetical protein